MNKKIIVVTTTIAVCLGLIFAGTKVYATTGKALNDTTRIREKATTNSKVVTVLDKGEKIEILSEEGDWYKVQYKTSNGKEIGYVRNDLLEVDSESKEKEDSKEENKTNTSSKTTEKEDTKNETSSQTANTEKESNSNANEVKNNEIENSNNENSSTEIEENVQIKLQNDTEVQLLPVIFSCKTGKISANEDITIIEVVGNWSHIQAENIEGWVLTSKLENATETTNKQEDKKEENNTKQEEVKEEEKKQEEQKEEKTNETTSKTEGIERKLYVSTTTLNLRESANAKSKVVTQLNLNDEVIVLEVVDNIWSKVKVNGKIGYTASEYLSKNKVADVTSRSNQEIRSSNEKKNETKKEENKSETANTNSTNTSKVNSTNTTATKNENSSSNQKQNTSNSNNNTWKVESSTNTSNANSTKTEATKTSTTKETSSKVATKTQVAKTEKNTTSSSSSSASSSSKGADVVAYAKKYLGTKYVYGATGPNSFDCSGFTSYVYRHFGYSLDRTSSAQRSNGTAVNKSDKQPGDLLCFSGHVGIYIGGNKFIHASHPGDYVKISSLSGYYTNTKPVIAVRRIVK